MMFVYFMGVSSIWLLSLNLILGGDGGAAADGLVSEHGYKKTTPVPHMGQELHTPAIPPKLTFLENALSLTRTIIRALKDNGTGFRRHLLGQSPFKPPSEVHSPRAIRP